MSGSVHLGATLFGGAIKSTQITQVILLFFYYSPLWDAANANICIVIEVFHVTSHGHVYA